MNHYAALAQEIAVAVKFLGSVPSSEARNQLAQARIFCLPSVTASNGDAEGLGLALIEAQACRVRVVTSARGGATEGILDGVSGYAFAEGDVTTPYTSLMRLLQQDDEAEAISHAGPTFVAERFDINRCTRALEDLYDVLAPGW
jgi:glycosyltransferase involved in cell wall biosynthesis